jgi:uncharacterized protein YjbJ (UPF0337 family)
MSADKDRVEGAAKKKMGEAKEAIGKVLGDEKLKRDGQADQATGTVQNAVGGIKDALRDKDSPSGRKDH